MNGIQRKMEHFILIMSRLDRMRRYGGNVRMAKTMSGKPKLMTGIEEMAAQFVLIE
jgi:hypothetical protein